MQRFVFEVDRCLGISSWDSGLERIIDRSGVELLGIPYYEVLPRIWVHDDDAIKVVINEGCSRTLRGFRFACFRGISEVDIRVEPISDANAQITGARVISDILTVCQPSSAQFSPASHDINQISTSLAHGVRNPLNAIKGAVVYLNEKFSHESTLVEFTGIIEEEIVKLDNFITKFLSAPFAEPEVAEVNIQETIKKIVQLTKLQAYSKNVSFECDLTETVPVKADSYQLDNAILNIINNAIEAMPGGGKIRIKTFPEQRDNDYYVCVAISDTGPGIACSQVETLLKSRMDVVNGRGRGFGLFITREIIQFHGGHMEISSEKNAGTKVTMFLPVFRSGVNHGR